MSPSLRVSVALAVTTVLGVVLAATLIFGALDRLRASAEEANTDFVLTQLRQSIEASVSLGLPLQDIRVAQDLIERARAAHREILAIEVYSVSGVAVFNTDRGALGEAISQTWREAMHRSQGRWRVEEVGALVIGEPILNDFGQPVGGIAVTVSLAERGAHASEVRASLVPTAVAAALVAGLVVGGLSYAGLQWVGRDFRAVTAALQADRGIDATATPALVREALAARHHIDGRARELESLAEAVSALDDADAWADPGPGEAERDAGADVR